MNYIEYTDATINEFIKNSTVGKPNILVVGAGYNCCRFNRTDSNIIQNDPDFDLADWVDIYKNEIDFSSFDLIILCRVFEHLPIRKVDWYMYQLYTILKPGGNLLIVTPNMEAVVTELNSQYSLGYPDDFLIKRLSYELFNEGKHVWDKHSIFTSSVSIKYHLEKENLFRVIRTAYVSIDTNLVPSQLEVLAERL
jgi:predicted SAM-dependent methyltransferase